MMKIRTLGKKPVFYARNGAAIYICTYNCLMGKNSMFGKNYAILYEKRRFTRP